MILFVACHEFVHSMPWIVYVAMYYKGHRVSWLHFHVMPCCYLLLKRHHGCIHDVWEKFFPSHFDLRREVVQDEGWESDFFETSNLASKPGFKIMAETLGINKIVVSWQHWLHLIGWKLLKVIFRLVTGMAIFNGFENCLLTLQPARDSTANVRPMCTLPISIFVQVCHYRGVSHLPGTQATWFM